MNPKAESSGRKWVNTVKRTVRACEISGRVVAGLVVGNHGNYPETRLWEVAGESSLAGSYHWQRCESQLRILKRCGTALASRRRAAFKGRESCWTIAGLCVDEELAPLVRKKFVEHVKEKHQAGRID